MIVKLTEEKIPVFTAVCAWERVYGSKMLTCLKTYGLENQRHHFYLCEVNGEPVAALYSDGSILTVTADEKADPAEVQKFALQEQVGEIDCNEPLCRTLQQMMDGEAEYSWFMVYGGTPVKADDPDMVPGDLPAVLAVLQQSHPFYREHYRYDTWSADIRAKMERGLLEVYQLVQDGEVVGIGSILSQDDECGIVGSVAVVPEYRHRGLGTRISLYLTARIQELGKTPRLMSGYDEVAALYRQIGYEPCGRWGELYL